MKIMSSYSLSTLLRLREYKKQSAENTLRSALDQLTTEKKKLVDIKDNLRNTIEARSKLQDSFFMQAKMTPCNKTRILCHISSREKNLGDEGVLRVALHDQENMVKKAVLELEIAQGTVMEAHRRLRVVEKHYGYWQQQQKRDEEIKHEYDNDDQNGVRFVLAKASSCR